MQNQDISQYFETLTQAEAIENAPKRAKEFRNGMVWHFDIEQGTPEWHEVRKGVITASCASVFLTSPFTTTGKLAAGSYGSFSKGAITYIKEKLAERLTTNTPESFKSFAMQQGNDREPFALQRLSEIFGPIDTVGFVCDDNGFYGCSPDGFNPDLLFEIKCPQSKTHLEYLMDIQNLKSDYNDQVQFQMLVTGHKQCVLASFNPDFREPKRQIIYTIIEADEAIHDVYRQQLLNAKEFFEVLYQSI